MIDRFEKFSLAILEIYHYWHKIAAEELKKYHLKGSHAVYLITLHKYPNGLTAPELADLCGKDKADVSRMLSILEANGLVTKESTNPKRYRGKLKLTEKGYQVAAQLEKRVALAVEKANQGITENERIIFTDCLDILTKNLKEISEKGL